MTDNEIATVLIMNTANSLPLDSNSHKQQLPKPPRNTAWTSCALLSVLAVAVATLTGCAGKYTGSGSIPSAAGEPGKATIAFNVQTDGDSDEDGVAEAVRGQIQFQDLAAGVRIHGKVLNALLIPESVWIDGVVWPAGAIYLEGTYISEPPSPDNEGVFNMVVSSPQTPGKQGGGEELLIILYGIQDSYYNYGLVSGGNITHHKEK